MFSVNASCQHIHVRVIFANPNRNDQSFGKETALGAQQRIDLAATTNTIDHEHFSWHHWPYLCTDILRLSHVETEAVAYHLTHKIRAHDHIDTSTVLHFNRWQYTSTAILESVCFPHSLRLPDAGMHEPMNSQIFLRIIQDAPCHGRTQLLTLLF